MNNIDFLNVCKTVMDRLSVSLPRDIFAQLQTSRAAQRDPWAPSVLRYNIYGKNRNLEQKFWHPTVCTYFITKHDSGLTWEAAFHYSVGQKVNCGGDKYGSWVQSVLEKLPEANGLKKNGFFMTNKLSAKETKMLGVTHAFRIKEGEEPPVKQLAEKLQWLIEQTWPEFEKAHLKK